MSRVGKPGTGHLPEIRTFLVCRCIKMVRIWTHPALPIAENLRIMAHWLRGGADPVCWHILCFNYA